MKKKFLLLGVAALLLPLAVSAQYTIYPIPHSQTAGTDKVSFTQTVNVICDNGIDEATQKRVTSVFAERGVTTSFSSTASTTQSNIYLGVKGANGATEAKAQAMGLNTDVVSKDSVFDRHVLALSDGGNGVAQLLVLGENTDATFMGLASLEQILDNGTTDLTTVTISDYADLKERGIIEGFYGKPYAKDVRLDLLRFMMRHKMNTYVYGAKSDPYHSGSWSTPYPTSDQLTDKQKSSGFVSSEDMQEFASVAHDTKVNVAWAIHPGNNLLNSSTVVDDIMTKFTSMYNLGFRQFAVFCDDVSIPSTVDGMNLTAERIGDLQKAIEAKWNVEGAAPADTVKPIRFTPQIYCRSFAGSETQYNNFFKALSAMPANVTVYYTGGAVWSVPNNNDLTTVQNQFGREVIWWWNYPCNDNGTGPNEIYPMDMYSNFYDMPNVNSNSRLPEKITVSRQGIICNPMEQGEASKTALFSAGDFGWNNAAYDNAQSWEASFKGVLRGNEKAQKAYRFLAPYLSKNDPSSLNTLINTYKSNGKTESLLSLMNEIITNCDVMTSLENSETDGERLLYTDIKPWVLRLRALASTTEDLLNIASTENSDDAWSKYINAVSTSIPALSTSSDFMAHHMSGFGSDYISTSERLTHASWRYLTPFVTDYLKDNAGSSIFGEKSTTATFVTNVENLGATPTVTYSDTRVLMMPGIGVTTLTPNGYLGYQLPAARLVSSVTFDDAYTNGEPFVTLVSADGSTWEQITNSTCPLDYVRYVVIKNISEEDQRLTLSMAKNIVNFAKAATVSATSIPDGTIWNGHTANLMCDGDYSTYVCLKQTQASGDIYQVTLTDTTEVRNVRICMGTTNSDYPSAANVQISADGKKWTTLRVLGTKNQKYTLDLPQGIVVAQSDGNDVIATDFAPFNTTKGELTPTKAKYVRMKLTASSDKWLRLCEIEVNGTNVTSLPGLANEGGLAVPNGVDHDGTTSTAAYELSSTAANNFVFNLSALNNTESVKLYCDPNNMPANVTYAITTDGTTWQEVEPTTGNGVLTITFKEEQSAATQLKMTWPKSASTPAFYEISETAGTEAQPIITAIQAATASSNAANSVILRNEGNMLTAQSAIAMARIDAYALNGQGIYSQDLCGAYEATIPTVGGQAIIVRVSLKDGQSQSFKVMK
jgi:hyaluronoglucosaminidase